MYIVQSENRPSEIQNALYDLMRTDFAGVRVCSAYVSLSGSQILFDGISRSAPNGDHEQIPKTIVTSLDFGLTDPEALDFWTNVAQCNVLVSGAALLDQGNLIPRTAFHPKVYFFDRPDGTTSSLVGSANLTNRGLTINSEMAWCERDQQTEAANSAWCAITAAAITVTPDIIERYRAQRERAARERPAQEPELEPVPEPAVGQLGQYRPFADADVEAEEYDKMWIQSRGMQGGARTQLELPRGAHRFFGAAYEGYDYSHVDHIAEPVLVSGRATWENRPLTWHGDNAMERINLPSRAMGGFEYENSLILFRRIAQNTYELRVFPWGSDSARAYVEASRRAGLVFRVGRNSNRIAGFLS